MHPMPLAAFVALFLSLPAHAADLIDCRLTGDNTLIPQVVVAELGVQGDPVRVNDPIIRAFAGGPVLGRVAIDNARRITISWTVRVRTTMNQEANISYRLTRQKATGAATITADAIGFQGSYRGQGQCTVRRGSL